MIAGALDRLPLLRFPAADPEVVLAIVEHDRGCRRDPIEDLLIQDQALKARVADLCMADDLAISEQPLHPRRDGILVAHAPAEKSRSAEEVDLAPGGTRGCPRHHAVAMGVDV